MQVDLTETEMKYMDYKLHLNDPDDLERVERVIRPMGYDVFHPDANTRFLIVRPAEKDA